MSVTKRLRDQHDQLLEFVSLISTKLNADELAKDAREVNQLLFTMLGKLSVHLAAEDHALYLRLLNHSDEEIRSMAKQYVDEMGGLGKVVNVYKNKWLNHADIRRDPKTFIEETKSIFSALGKRIEKENNELFKALDNWDKLVSF